MHADFGYIEEGKLGKPYNIRLLKRLSEYALPYWRIIALALTVAVAITLLDLVLPFLTKVAIDRYILSSYEEVIPDKADKAEIIKKYKKIMIFSNDNKTAYIHRGDLKDIDPADLHEYRRDGVISGTSWYIFDTEKYTMVEKEAGERYEHIILSDGRIALTKGVIDGLPAHLILSARSSDFNGLIKIGIFLIFVLLITFGLNYLDYYLLEYIGQNIMQDVRVALFERIQSRALSFFNRHPVGRLVTRVTNDIENLNEMFKSVLVTLFTDIFILVGIIAMLLYLNWRLALISFIILPVIFIFTIVVSRMMRDAFRILREKVSKLNAFQQEQIAGMRIIQLLAREKYQMRVFHGLNHENYLAGMYQLKLFAIFVPVMEFISAVGVALIIWYGGGRVISDQMSLGSLVAFVSYIQMFFRPIRDISEKYNIMQLAMASTERIFEFMDNGEMIPDPEFPVIIPEKRGEIEFRNVTFSYDAGRPVLNDVSFKINPGEMVAVVGATGAGKSTIVNLIERFYDPDKGLILLDGVDIRTIKKADIRSRISLVMQDVFLFSGDLKENISLGNESVTQADIEEAAIEANAKWFIDKLPERFSQEISEGGTTLSGGERQLLSFSRALAHDTDILILDEATSSVDPETERQIQDAINRMTASRTTLVIAHRLSTIKKADRIIVMGHGRIIEQGTHYELMEAKGKYYRLNLFRESYNEEK
ncbi:MAG: ABC transporter ATP-binding protein [Desulfatiglans sp.]|jgi:ABC-type multidrug transport system fused ATPase/permease subunit|nr:ABC transporter ATP-binding protein [Desulfatiglans sp.]